MNRHDCFPTSSPAPMSIPYLQAASGKNRHMRQYVESCLQQFKCEVSGRGCLPYNGGVDIVLARLAAVDSHCSKNVLVRGRIVIGTRTRRSPAFRFSFVFFWRNRTVETWELEGARAVAILRPPRPLKPPACLAGLRQQLFRFTVKRKPRRINEYVVSTRRMIGVSELDQKIAGQI